MIKVIIIDDEKTIRTGLRDFIDRIEGFKVEATCQDGIEALSLMENVLPDLVITDIRMPLMDGLEFTKRCQHLPSRPLVIIISGYPNFEYAQTAIQLETFDYILKPINFNKLKYVLLKAADTIRERKAERFMLMDQLGALLVQSESPYINDQSARLFNRITQGQGENNHVLVFDNFSTECISVQHMEKIRLLILQELSNSISNHIVHFLHDRRVGLILNNYKANLQEIESLSLKIIHRIRSALPFVQVTAGYGGTFKIATNLPVVYKRALIATYERMHVEDIQFVQYQHTWDDKQTIEEQVRTTLDEIILAAKKQDLERAHMQLNYFSEKFHANDLSPLALLELHHSMGEICKISAFSYFSSFNTFNEWQEKMLELIDDCFQLYNIGLEDNYSPLVKRAVKYIRANYMDEINLQTMQNLLNINRSYFCKVFKDETGMTFNHYLNEIRLEKAKDLLKNHNLKIHEVASLTGFRNEKYFFKVFKEKTGKTPKKYASLL